MSELSLGGNDFPTGWGQPNPIYNHETGEYENGGVVWHGEENATMADVQAMVAYSPNVKIDWPTCVGGDDYYTRKYESGYPYKQTVILG